MKDADADCEGNSHQVLHKLATRATTADRAHFLALCRIKAGVDNGDPLGNATKKGGNGDAALLGRLQSISMLK